VDFNSLGELNTIKSKVAGATDSRGIDQKMQKSSQFCYKRIDEVELKR
jgi:hypothetical protein